MNRFRNRQRRGSGGSSGFSAGAVGAGTLKMWLRADTVVLNGADVLTLTDKSGLGNSPTQAAGPNQPLWVASAQNSKPCVRYTAANSDCHVKGATDLLGTGPYTVFLVIQDRTIIADSCYFGLDDTLGGAGVFFGLRNTSPNRNANHTNVATHADDAMQSTAPEIWCMQYTAGAGPTFQLNGTTVALANSSTSGLLATGGTNGAITVGGRTGGTDFSDLDFYEAIVYSSNLSAADRGRATAYLRGRYNL